MNGVTVSTQKTGVIAAEDLVAELLLLQKALDKLKEKVFQAVPVKYGSDAWWEKTERKSREEYAAGKYITLKDGNDIDKFFQKFLQK